MPEIASSPKGLVNDILKAYRPDIDLIPNDLLGKYAITNTDSFREAALCFKETGKFTEDRKGTKAYKLFWERESDRCVNGYHAGHDRITGYHYHYLNYSPILLISKEDEERLVKSNGKITADVVRDFPHFWDGDYLFFHYVEEAELNSEFAHCTKTRGRGYSYKLASMMNRNFFHIPYSSSFVIVDNSTVLEEAEFLKKLSQTRSFISEHTAFAKGLSIDKVYHKKHGYFEQTDEGVWIEKGFQSEMIAIVMDGNTDKIRGLRGKLIAFEEAGAFRKLPKALKVCQTSLKQGDIMRGLRLSFGTGGSDELVSEGLEQLTYSPRSLSVRCLDNIWDEGMEHDKVSLFMPEYMNRSGYMDKDGNSNIVAAIRRIREEYEILEADNNPKALADHKSEQPIRLGDALSVNNESFFDSAKHSSYARMLLTLDNYKLLPKYGRFIPGENTKLKFVRDNSLIPLNSFPTPTEVKKDGCVTIYFDRYINQDLGIAPPDHYITIVDPYGLNTDGGESLARASVFALPNCNVPVHFSDCLVAQYTGRPKEQDDANEIIFQLADYYNSKIYYENDRGNILDYAKRTNRVHMLHEEFSLLVGNKEKGTLGRRFGFSMSDLAVKLQAISDLKAWWQNVRGDRFNGNITNLELTYDAGVHQEASKYRLKDNRFDRISTFLGYMLYRKHFIFSIAEKLNNKEVEREVLDLFRA